MRRISHLFLILVLALTLILPRVAQARAAMTLSSTAFLEGARIPQAYTCSGVDKSPALAWNNVPSDAKSLILIVKDPDAPHGTFVHWVIYDMPPAIQGLTENQPRTATLQSGGRQGMTSFGRIGYGGPCPPPGKPHHYYFRLYALDRELNLSGDANADEVEQAAHGHILAVAELVGIFQR